MGFMGAGTGAALDPASKKRIWRNDYASICKRNAGKSGAIEGYLE